MHVKTAIQRSVAGLFCPVLLLVFFASFPSDVWASPWEKSPVPIGDSHVLGSSNALVTIVQFADFESDSSARAQETLRGLRRMFRRNLRIVFKHHPASNHDLGGLAAKAVEAAGEQRQFWRMHDLLWTNPRTLSREQLFFYARRLGLNMKRFRAAIDSARLDAKIREDQLLATRLKVSTSPHFFINGVAVSASQPLIRIVRIVDKQLAEAKALAKKLKRRRDLYPLMSRFNFYAGQSRIGEVVPMDLHNVRDSIKVPVGQSYFKGSADALVTIVEFAEFQCPFCARAQPTLDKILERYKQDVRVVFKHNPLPFHKDAPLAAQAALAAGEQGKFWEMQDLLWEDTKALKESNLLEYAEKVGLDLAKFKADLRSEKIKKMIADDQSVARKTGARGTPHFFINGKRLTGAQPFPNFVKVIDAELEAARAELQRGTPKGEIYAKMADKNYAPAAPRKPRGDSANDSKVVYKVPIGESPTKGGNRPLVTIIEFSDFKCGFCGRVLNTLDQILETYGDDVQIVFKHNTQRTRDMSAALAAMAASKQGKFWEMHDLLFDNMRNHSAKDINAYAQRLGLNMFKFEKDLKDPKLTAAIKADEKVANTFAARGTPHFFINGRRLVGAQPLRNFKKLIDEELEKAKAELKKGTSRGQIYAAVTSQGKTKAEASARPRRKPPTVDNVVYKVPIGDSYARGGREPLVTIIQFTDFKCGFCGRALKTLDEINKIYGNKVKVVVKHNTQRTRDASASKAALAAGQQGKFFEMHDLLFQNMRKQMPADLKAYAKQIGLNMVKFEKDLNSPEIAAAIQADEKVANTFAARGTPHFFINGRRLRGAQPLQNFKKLIDEEIKKAEALLKAGTPRSKIYARITAKGAAAAQAPSRPRPKEDKTIYTVPIGPNDMVVGNPHAPITIVEFGDFQCPFCRRAAETVALLRKAYGNKLRFVFKHNPLSFHKNAPLAAEAVLAAAAQGKGWEMHDILFKNQQALARPQLEKYAAKLGINMSKFKDALDSRKYKAQISVDQKLAGELKARGTPHFFINGRRLAGAQPYPRFEALIDELLDAQGN